MTVIFSPFHGLLSYLAFWASGRVSITSKLTGFILEDVFVAHRRKFSKISTIILKYARKFTVLPYKQKFFEIGRKLALAALLLCKTIMLIGKKV